MRAVVRRLNDVVAGRLFHDDFADAISDKVAGQQDVTPGVFKVNNQTIGVFGGKQIQNASRSGMQDLNFVLF